MGNAQYQYTLQDDNLAELNAWAPKMLAKLKTLPVLQRREHRPAGSRIAGTGDRSRHARRGSGCRRQTIDNTLYDASASGRSRRCTCR